MSLTKRDLILHLAETLGMQQNDVAKIVDTTLATIADSLAEGKQWELRDFGVFEVKSRLPRKARNPRTGEAAVVPKRKVVVFRAGKRMRERIANGTAHIAETPSNGSTRQQASPSSSASESETASLAKETTRI
ncbi:MAG: HU family DNA-binding protein [Candidatus Hydrogenedentota bacterium]